jgi:hypothetical protein
MFGLNTKRNPKNYSKWKIVSFTESMGWVTITQYREDVDSGLKEFKHEKIWINTRPELLQKMYNKIMSI